MLYGVLGLHVYRGRILISTESEDGGIPEYRIVLECGTPIYSCPFVEAHTKFPVSHTLYGWQTVQISSDIGESQLCCQYDHPRSKVNNIHRNT